MKTKIRPLAMRCTQEQFNSIKDRINLPVSSITDFNRYPYLINCDYGKLSNIDKNEGFEHIWEKNPEVYETFDANIFLEACGEEIEKVWFGSEMQRQSVDTGEWLDCFPNSKYRFKPQPNYDIEIQALQDKAKANGMKVTINFEKI